jgi:HAD superfamily hydrolase (TIGR01509 family)
MSLRAVVFDFDGVIADSEPLHLRAFQDVLREDGISLTTEDYYARYLGFDDEGVFRAVGDANRRVWASDRIDALVVRKARRMEALTENVSVLFPGAADAIRRIAAAVPVAIASGALTAEIRRILDRERLSSAFTAIVAAEDAPSKPAPDPYLQAVAKIAAAGHGPLAPGDCAAIEDSVWGIQSARAAGLRVVGVTTTYEASHLVDADLIVASLHDLTLEALEACCR